MTKEPLPIKTLLAMILGMTAGSLGCSGGEDAPSGSGGARSSGGSGTLVSGGAPAMGGQTATGGLTNASGGSLQSGGAPASGGTVSSSGGGGTSGGSGGATAGGGAGGDMSGMTAGTTSKGGSGNAGSGNAGSSNAGSSNAGSSNAGAGNGGNGAGGASSGGKSGSGGSGGAFTGTCTASKGAGRNVSGTGPHKVVIETNPAAGIKCGTIYRPEDLGGGEKYPIFVWGEGACSQDGLSNQAAMGEIASWGYFVVADGTPGSNGACGGGQDGKALLDYITWAIAENDKPCSEYYQSLEPTKIAADGFSCGGLMAENVSGDPRLTAVGITSSGLMAANANLYSKIHTPFKVMNGGSSDIAYENGLRDYQEISKLGKPAIYFSKKSAGHGGDLGQGRGDFNLVNLAWLNWQLKGEEGATGKGYLTGSTCKICTDSGWDYKIANLP